MKPALVLFVCVLTLAAVPCSAAEAPDSTQPVKKLSSDERKRRFEALKKELEAFKPAQDAERDEVLVYLQQVLDASTKFAKENPKTAEGFEAASSGAMQLAARSHPKSCELAQLALDVKPAAGVEVKQIAICWLLVANGNIVKGDFKAARASLENMKDLSPELYALAIKQVDEQEAKAKDAKK